MFRWLLVLGGKKQMKKDLPCEIAYEINLRQKEITEHDFSPIISGQ